MPHGSSSAIGLFADGVVDGDGEQGAFVGLVDVGGGVAEGQRAGHGPAVAVAGDVGQELLGGRVDRCRVGRDELGGEGHEPRFAVVGGGGEVGVRRVGERVDEWRDVGAGQAVARGCG